MKIKIIYQCVFSQQKFVLPFNRTRFSTIWSVNEQNLRDRKDARGVLYFSNICYKYMI